MAPIARDGLLHFDKASLVTYVRSVAALLMSSALRPYQGPLAIVTNASCRSAMEGPAEAGPLRFQDAVWPYPQRIEPYRKIIFQTETLPAGLTGGKQSGILASSPEGARDRTHAPFRISIPNGHSNGPHRQAEIPTCAHASTPGPMGKLAGECRGRVKENPDVRTSR